MRQRLSFSAVNLKKSEDKFCAGKSAERWSGSRTARTGTRRPTWTGRSPSVATASRLLSLNISSTWGQWEVRRRKSPELAHLSPFLLTLSLSLGPFLISVAFSLNLSLNVVISKAFDSTVIKSVETYTCRHELNTKHLCIENITWYAWLLFQSHSHTIVCFPFDLMFSILTPQFCPILDAIRWWG